MPLVRFEVRNEVGLGDPGLYGGGGGAGKRGGGEAEPKVLLEGVAVAGLVGILRQLGDLADSIRRMLVSGSRVGSGALRVRWFWRASEAGQVFGAGL